MCATLTPPLLEHTKLSEYPREDKKTEQPNKHAIIHEMQLLEKWMWLEKNVH